MTALLVDSFKLIEIQETGIDYLVRESVIRLAMPFEKPLGGLRSARKHFQRTQNTEAIEEMERMKRSRPKPRPRHPRGTWSVRMAVSNLPLRANR